MIAREGGKRIGGAPATSADGFAADRVPAPDHAIGAAGEKGAVIRKKATDHTGRPGPTRVRASVPRRAR